VSSFTFQVYLSVRDGAWCVPRVWDNGLPLDLAMSTRFYKFLSRLLPSSVVSNYFQKAANARFDHALYGLQPRREIMAGLMVVNDDLPSRILSGSVQVRPGIARLTSSGVQFTDGTYVDDIAAVICATGKYTQVRSTIAPPQKKRKKSQKYFSGKYCVKFWHFSGKIV